jgi:lipoprotein signal peptidase
VADAGITVGAILLIVDTLFSGRDKGDAEDKSGGA